MYKLNVRGYGAVIYSGIAVLAAVAFLMVYRCGISARTDVFSVIRPVSILIGDTVEISVVFTGGTGCEVEMPDMEANLPDGFTVRGKDFHTSTFLRRKTVTRSLYVTTYNTGTYEIKSMDVKYRSPGSAGWNDMGTQARFLTVRTLVTEDLEDDRKITFGGGISSGMISPITGQADTSGGGGRSRSVDAPIRYRINDIGPLRRVRDTGETVKMAVVLAVSGIVVIAVVLAVKKIRAARLARERGDIFSLALKRLEYIRRGGTLPKGNYRSFCDQLYLTLSDYIRARYGLGWSEMTPEELTAAVTGISGLSDTQKDLLVRRIRTCADVKYSGYVPLKGELDPELTEEFRLVDDTRIDKDGTSSSGGKT